MNTTTTNETNNEQEQDEELQILSSINVNRTELTSYEDLVIRTITHSNVPSFYDNSTNDCSNNDNDDTIGDNTNTNNDKLPLFTVQFPNLSTLVDTQQQTQKQKQQIRQQQQLDNSSSNNNNTNDRIIIERTIQQIQHQITETQLQLQQQQQQQETTVQSDTKTVQHMNMLCIKEQMLLSYLTTIHNVSKNDLPLRSKKDRMILDHLRSTAITSSTSSSTSSTSNKQLQLLQRLGNTTTITGTKLNKRIPMMQRKKIILPQQSNNKNNINNNKQEILNELSISKEEIEKLRQVRIKNQQRKEQRRHQHYRYTNSTTTTSSDTKNNNEDTNLQEQQQEQQQDITVIPIEVDDQNNNEMPDNDNNNNTTSIIDDVAAVSTTTTTTTTTTAQQSDLDQSTTLVFKNNLDGNDNKSIISHDNSNNNNNTNSNDVATVCTTTTTTTVASQQQQSDLQQSATGSIVSINSLKNDNNNNNSNNECTKSKINEDESISTIKIETESGKSNHVTEVVSTTNTSNIIVNCPLCFIQISCTTGSQDDVDTMLAQHINVCQNTTRAGTSTCSTMRRSSRRHASTIASERITKQQHINDDTNIDDDIDMTNKSKPASSSPRIKQSSGKRKQPTNTNSNNTNRSDDNDDWNESNKMFSIDSDIDTDENDIGEVDEDDVNSEIRLNNRSKKSKKVTTTSLTTKSTLPFDDYDVNDYEDRVDEWITNGISKMKVVLERDMNEELPGEEIYDNGFVVPEWVNNNIFSYQRVLVRWLWDLHNSKGVGGIIGDEMGLGKTVQTCAFLGCAALSRKVHSILLIAPATMLQHWLNELSIWSPGLRRICIHSSASSSSTSTSTSDVHSNGETTKCISSKLLQSLSQWLHTCRQNRVYEPIDEQDIIDTPAHAFVGTGYVVLTTYENLRRNANTYVHHDWSYIVLDEAQKIRNPTADITVTCKRIRTPHRIAISGTPIQNDLRELWSIFDFVYPGRLGTLSAFEQEFANPIRRGGYTNASAIQVQVAYRCAITLREMIEPYLLRRLKKDIKEVSRMPKKTEHVLFCKLTSVQRNMYESFLKSDNVLRVIRGTAQMFAAVTMLRKICNHPDLVCDNPNEVSSYEDFFNTTTTTRKSTIHSRKRTIQENHLNNDISDDDVDDDDLDDDNVEYDSEAALIERSGKLEVLCKILPLWKKQGHRVLIFCQWKKMLSIIQSFIIHQQWKYCRLDGNTNIGTRQHLVDTFNNDCTIFTMLCTTRTGGVGLNLTGANRIILYDPDWNPSTDQQARERVWRFGQKRDVTIYRFITAGTIEEKIYHRQIFKTALTNRILQDPKQRRLFSYKDLKSLFTLGPDNTSATSTSGTSRGVGMTDTSIATKGIGMIDGQIDLDPEPDSVDDNNNSNSNNNNKDNDDTLRKVMQSKGLAAIFDHHSIENDPSRKSTTVREMEVEAKRVAQEAVRALENSIVQQNHTNNTSNQFIPAWTDNNSSNGRFGSSTVFTSGNSSSSLLASLKQKQAKVEDYDGMENVDNDTTTNNNKNATKFVKLFVRIKEYIQRYTPTTDDLLNEFNSIIIDDNDTNTHDKTNNNTATVAIFRQLVKSVAIVVDGKWYIT